MAKGKTTIKGANAADKQNIALARKANKAEAEGKVEVVGKGEDAPEAKRTTAQKSAAAEKMFKNADEAMKAGLPETLTVEQHENMVRRAALGY